jgi:hypothetical protein
MAMLRRLRRKPLVPITRANGEVFGVLAAKLTQAGRERSSESRMFGSPRRLLSESSRC